MGGLGITCKDLLMIDRGGLQRMGTWGLGVICHVLLRINARLEHDLP